MRIYRIIKPNPLKILLFVLLLSITWCSGWYIGYINGAENQVYFDAVAKASLFKFAINSKNPSLEEVINGLLLKQKCLLGSDFDFKTITIYHPIHDEVREFYLVNRDAVCDFDPNCNCEKNLILEPNVDTINRTR